ncbi:hypothetical protein [Marmoricola sp. URHA0025 HA25]
MIPIRRARACGLPSESGASALLMKSYAARRVAFRATSAFQSNARPSLCSLRPPLLHARIIPMDPVAL